MTSPALEQWTPLERSIPKGDFKAEVSAWAKRIGVEPKEVHIRPMRRKWGSCSSNGRVSFNSELLDAPADARKRIRYHPQSGWFDEGPSKGASVV